MDMNQLKAIAESLHQKYRKSQDEGYGNLQGLENVIKQQQGQPEVNTSTETPRGYCMGGQVSGAIDGYAEGGIVDDPFKQQLEAGTVPGLQFNPNSGLPPAPPPPQVNIQQPQMTSAGVNPVNQYLDTQKAQLNKFGPEQQLALSQSLAQQHGGLRQTGARTLGTLADGIMQGVARAGSGGFADRVANDQNTQDKQQIESLSNAGKLNTERTEANQKLDTQDPRSPLSQSAQKAWAGVLQQTGLKPEQIANMSAANIAAITGQSVDIVKAKAEAEMARASLGLNTQKFHSEDDARKQAVVDKEQEQKLGAAKTLAGRGMFKKATDAIFGDPGTELLEKQVNGTGAGPSIPEGRVTVIGPNGQVGHIPENRLNDYLENGYKRG